MLPSKFMLFAVVALVIVNGAIAIIGGQSATPGQFPYFVLLKTTRTNEPETIQQSCGGALLSDQWIVTSARCLVSTDGTEVHLGVRNLTNRYEKGRKIFHVIKDDYHIHPSYQRGTHHIGDIALIKLLWPVKYSEYIQPIQLSDSIMPTLIGKRVTAMGYGLKNLIFEGLPDNLQYTEFAITNFEKCVANATAINKSGVVCAMVQQGRLCYGDIGSPLVSPESGKLVGIAVTSSWHDCEVGRWQSFTDITAYSKWIEGKIYVVSRMRLDY